MSPTTILSSSWSCSIIATKTVIRLLNIDLSWTWISNPLNIRYLIIKVASDIIHRFIPWFLLWNLKSIMVLHRRVITFFSTFFYFIILWSVNLFLRFLTLATWGTWLLLSILNLDTTKFLVILFPLNDVSNSLNLACA